MLCVDTELQEEDFQWIAKQIIASGYSLEHTRRILLEEVLPVCSGNLHTPAGVWQGFDLTWLGSRIRASSPPGFLARVRGRMDFALIREDWKKIAHMVQEGTSDGRNNGEEQG